MGNECSNCVNEKTDKKKQWEYDNDNSYQRGQNQGFRYQNNSLDNSYSHKPQQLPHQVEFNFNQIIQQFHNSFININQQRVGANIFTNGNGQIANKSYNYQQPDSYQDYYDQQNNQSHSQIAYNNPPQQINQSQHDMSGYQKSQIFDRKNESSGRINPEVDILSHNQSRSQLYNQQNQNMITSKPITNQSFGGQLFNKTFDNVSSNLNEQRDNSSNFLIEDRGEIELENGAVYQGQWKGDMREGKGIQRWPDGAVYEGEWKNDRAEGKGKFYHANGDYFEGEWSDDKANGKGIYKHKNGSIYDGDWKDDHKDGYGVETWSDGSRYEGYYNQGKKHGKGKYQWSDGSSYDGFWSHNQLNGFGVYSWRDGRVYSGFWRNNFMHGKGKYTWSDGRFYEGEYENDKKHGYGTYVWIDKKRYEGYWFKGKQHGKGKIIIPDENDQIKCIKFVQYKNGKKKEITQEEFNNMEEHQVVTDPSNYFLKNEGDKVDTSELGVNLQDDFFQQANQNKSDNDWDTRRPILISTQSVVDQNMYFKNANNQKQVNSNEGSKIGSAEVSKIQNQGMADRNQNHNEEKGITTNVYQNEQQHHQQILQQNSSQQNLNQINQIQQSNNSQIQNPQFTFFQNQSTKIQNSQIQNGQNSNEQHMKISQNQQFYTPNSNYPQNQDHILQNEQQIQLDQNIQQNQFYNIQQQQQEQKQQFPQQQFSSKQQIQSLQQINQDTYEVLQRQPSNKGYEAQVQQNSRVNMSNIQQQGKQDQNNGQYQQQNGQLSRNTSQFQQGQNKVHQYDLLQANGKVTMPTLQQQKIYSNNSQTNFDNINQVNNRNSSQKQQY